MIPYILLAFGIIILIVYISRYISDHATNESTKMVIQWFTLLIIINIIITTFILSSYTTIKFKKGPRGPQGKRGVDGTQGKNGTCIMCGPALMGLKPVRLSNRIDRIDPMIPNEERKLFVTNRKQST
jgi:hypothetical protein